MEGQEAPGNGPPPWPGAPPDPRDTQTNGDASAAREGADGRAGVLSQDSIVPETQPSQEDEDQVHHRSDGEKQEVTASAQKATTQEEGRPQGQEQTGEADTGQRRQGDSGDQEPQVDGEQDQPASEAAAPPRSSPPEAVRPEDIFNALVEEMKAAPARAHVEAWRVTVAELFADVFDKVQVKRERVSPNKQRYPKLKGAEFAQLLSFFEEACVIDLCGYTQWCKHATLISQDLYNTTWTLTTILESMTSKIKWARAPILNQWAAKVTNSGGNQQYRDEGSSHFQPFMFNPAKYQPQDIARLTQLCEQPEAARVGQRLRDGTDDEWVIIIQGLAEGNIVSRKLPAFIKSIFDSKERLRLYSTIQAQVEGELRFALIGHGSVPVSRQHTQAIKEDILLAAECTKVNLAELHQMLIHTKTISYNRVQKSIHFFFFDRATARKFQFTVGPFKRRTYRLQNMHAPTSGIAWSRQLGADGVRMAPQAEYEVRLYNVTRFLDIGRLTA